MQNLQSNRLAKALLNSFSIGYRARNSFKHTNISNKAKTKKVAGSKGHLSGEANMFHCWSNERGWWLVGTSPQLCMFCPDLRVYCSEAVQPMPPF